jgi:predicted hydrocarbon binding protein
MCQRATDQKLTELPQDLPQGHIHPRRRKPVQVEITQSIKNGAEYCEFIIQI